MSIEKRATILPRLRFLMTLGVLLIIVGGTYFYVKGDAFLSSIEHRDEENQQNELGDKLQLSLKVIEIPVVQTTIEAQRGEKDQYELRAAYLGVSSRAWESPDPEDDDKLVHLIGEENVQRIIESKLVEYPPTVRSHDIAFFVYDNTVYILVASTVSNLEFALYVYKGNALIRVPPISESPDETPNSFIVFESPQEFYFVGESILVHGVSQNGFDETFSVLRGGRITDERRFFNDESLPMRISLLGREGNVVIRVENGFSYIAKSTQEEFCILGPFSRETYPTASSCVEYVFAGVGINNYFSIDRHGKLTMVNGFFKEDYLKEAREYEKALDNESFISVQETFASLKYDAGDSPYHQYANITNDWLSPLIGETLNLVFAGEDNKAWEEFAKEFAALDAEYPIPASFRDVITAEKIKVEIQEELEKKALR